MDKTVYCTPERSPLPAHMRQTALAPGLRARLPAHMRPTAAAPVVAAPRTVALPIPPLPRAKPRRLRWFLMVLLACGLFGAGAAALQLGASRAAKRLPSLGAPDRAAPPTVDPGPRPESPQSQRRARP